MPRNTLFILKGARHDAYEYQGIINFEFYIYTAYDAYYIIFLTSTSVM